MSVSIKYRPEIDGLRAMAVLPVILFHASLLRGGFLGVDIFFVISGYLITSIIYAETLNGSFSIIRFYERRMRRILPVLFFIILLCIPFAWLWMMPAEFKLFSESIVATNLFASNILFYQKIDYFSPNIETFPLIHTWSLAVEEQFYVFFPLLFVTFAKFRRILLISLVILITVFSLALAQWTAKAHSQFDFFLLPTRAWELGFGVIIALIPISKIKIPPMMSQIIAFAGLSILLYSFFAFTQDMPLPGLWSLFPVGGGSSSHFICHPKYMVRATT